MLFHFFYPCWIVSHLQSASPVHYNLSARYSINVLALANNTQQDEYS